MTRDYSAPFDANDHVQAARAALIIAAMRRTQVTYGELATALGLMPRNERTQVPRILDALTAWQQDAPDRGPRLAALVVREDNGTGWKPVPGGRDQQHEARLVFKHWPPK